MPHNSIFGILSSATPMSISARGSSSASSSPPAKRLRDFSSMSPSDRPELTRPPSSSRSAQMPPPKSSSLLRRRPAAPRQTSSTENPLNLKLPEVTLGRYHPINFSSQHSSVAATPSPGLNSPQPPMSPRSHSRQLSEAERRLHEYYRDRAIASGRAGFSPSDKPTVPRLEAAVSPGPVTPLELEAAASYFGVAAAAASPTKKSPDGRSGNLSCQGSVRHSMEARTPPIGSY